MLSGLERHFSVVSLLLIAGVGLIILEGPVGPSYLRQFIAPKAVEKPAPKALDGQAQAKSNSGQQEAKAINLDSPATTWASTADDAAPSHSPMLGEIPVSDSGSPISR